MKNMIHRMSPVTALLYKEWLKVRFYLLAASIVWGAALLATYILALRMGRMHGFPTVWNAVLYNDYNLLAPLRWIPLAVGLALGMAQFLPEMRLRRLKLTLHLPMPDSQILAAMLGFGYALQLVASCIAIILARFLLLSLLPFEIVDANVRTSLPWFLAGFSAYGLVAWICLEPTVRRRITGAILSALCISLYFLSSRLDAYATFIWVLLLFAFGLVPVLCFGALARFREGESVNAPLLATRCARASSREGSTGVKNIAYSLLLLLGVTLSSTIFPYVYHLTLDRQYDLPFTVYSGITNTFAVFEGTAETARYRDDAGRSYTRKEFDSILPTIYYTQLIRDGRFPDSLFGVPVDAEMMSSHFFVFHSRPAELNQRSIPLYPIVNADSERVTIADAYEAFRWMPNGIEIIQMEGNSVNSKKTEHFRAALADVSLPVSITVRNPDPRKERDNGYLIVDAKSVLWQLKQQDGEPIVGRLLAPQDESIRSACVTEFDDPSYLGYLSTESGRFFSLDAQQGQCAELPIERFFPRREAIMIFGNLFDQTVRIIDGSSVHYMAISSDTPYRQLRTYRLEVPSDLADAVARWLFPFELTFTSGDSAYIYPRLLMGWSWRCIPLCLLLATGIALLARRESRPRFILKVLGVLVFGLFLAVPLLLWRR